MGGKYGWHGLTDAVQTARRPPRGPMQNEGHPVWVAVQRPLYLTKRVLEKQDPHAPESSKDVLPIQLTNRRVSNPPCSLWAWRRRRRRLRRGCNARRRVYRQGLHCKIRATVNSLSGGSSRRISLEEEEEEKEEAGEIH